ncbi:MAG: TolC family protein, partial [Desulfomonilia bacterium]
MIALYPQGLRAADEIKPGETLDLARCITIALKNHPTVLGAAGSLKASQSRVNEARANYYPQVGASSAYSRNYAQGGTSAAAPGSSYYNEYQDSLNL